MQKLIAATTSALGALTVSMALFGTAVAAADDPYSGYIGKTYADVSKAISDAKLKAVIAGRVGDALPDDQCTVTRGEKASFIKGDHFARVTDTVLVYLNCNAAVASATTPGNSVASPEGRAAKQTQDTADYINAHPEYCAQNAQNAKTCKDFCDAHSGLCTA